uniref:Immunoglobulin V-set domain-containing protein n=1 Tax=Plectus sambesii TaxID=2011161 RepID=A0A914X142_9BILA
MGGAVEWLIGGKTRNDDFSLGDIPSIAVEDAINMQNSTKLATHASKSTQQQFFVDHGTTVFSNRMSSVTELKLADASMLYCSVRGWLLSDDSTMLMATLDHPIKSIHTSSTFTIDS